MKFNKISRSSALCSFALGAVLLSASAQGATIVGVSINDVSSELEDGTTDRLAVNTINGSGFNETTGTHSVDGTTMWETKGTYQNPNDPLGAYPNSFIEFDLGSNYDLASTTVWNYNETNETDRGANSVTISVAETVGGLFTSLGNFTFTQTPSNGTATTDFGQNIALSGANNARLVRFDILSAHGQDLNLVGLSEVRFDGTVVPEPSAALLGALGLLTLLRRRR